MYVLIIVTYLGGATWGPIASMQEFSSKTACSQASRVAIKMTEDMNKTNLRGGSSMRDIIKAECIKE